MIPASPRPSPILQWEVPTRLKKGLFEFLLVYLQEKQLPALCFVASLGGLPVGNSAVGYVGHLSFSVKTHPLPVRLQRGRVHK